ncbi:hypothetical protein [Halorussus caseinilyticus]|uniref:Uncharacterized protein n=1 Tax=Halorussus caseinilyticus TaxID=3034025 RepID=A0ABD5WFQ5_9EURY
MSDGQYAAAKKAVGGEYSDEYERYADIADRMEGGPTDPKPSNAPSGNSGRF